MIIEYGHIYVDDIYNGTIDVDSISKSIVEAIKQNRLNIVSKNVVLIDDKDYSLSNDEKNNIEQIVRELYKKLGLEPDEVFFEKKFKDYDYIIFDNIDDAKFKSEKFRKDKKIVHFLKVGDHKIPIKQVRDGDTSYSCQFLSSLWLLYKKGLMIDGVYSPTLTILNRKYKKIEEQVLLILETAGYSKEQLKDNNYIWID